MITEKNLLFINQSKPSVLLIILKSVADFIAFGFVIGIIREFSIA